MLPGVGQSDFTSPDLGFIKADPIRNTTNGGIIPIVQIVSCREYGWLTSGSDALRRRAKPG